MKHTVNAHKPKARANGASSHGEARMLSVASYNIHRCIGLDGRYNPARIAQVIKHLDVAIIALQEVDSRDKKAGSSQQMEYLAHATGFTPIAGPTLKRKTGDYGNVLLTNYPILDVRRFDLTVSGREPRGAIDVDLDIAGEPVRVLATHLGLRAAERRLQVKRLLEALAEERTRVLIVLGDMNEWSPAGRPLQWLDARLGKVRTPLTFPSAFPVFALDRIWVQPKEALANIRVHALAPARLASDHLPVKGIIHL